MNNKQLSVPKGFIIFPVVTACVLQYLLFSGYMVGLQSHLYSHGRISFYENLKAIYYIVSFIGPFSIPYILKYVKLRTLVLFLVFFTVLSFYLILFTGKDSYLYVYSAIQGFTRSCLLFLSIYVINHYTTKVKGSIYMSYLTSLFSFAVILGSLIIAHISTSSPIIFYGGVVIGLAVLAILFFIPGELRFSNENKESQVFRDYLSVLRKNAVFFIVCALVFINWSIGESYITMWGKSINMSKVGAVELTSYFYAGGVILTFIFIKFFNILKKNKQPILYVAMFSLSLYICVIIYLLGGLSSKSIVLISLGTSLFGGAVVAQITVVSNAIQHFITQDSIKCATVIFVALQHCMGVLTTYFIGEEIRRYQGTGFIISVLGINILIFIITLLLKKKRTTSNFNS
jgi:MFS family permease